MATAPAFEIDTAASASTDIVVAVSKDPGLVLLDRAKFDAFYTKMKAETDKLDPDTSTAKGRDEIRSMAARVTRSKTTIDSARLTLTAEWRENVKRANEAGKEITERLDGLAKEVREPLTRWEEAEKARAAECALVIGGFKSAAIVTEDDTFATVRARGSSVHGTVLDPDRFGDLLGEAQSAKEQAVQVLLAAARRLKKAEEEAAELAALRAEKEERDRLVEQERLAREAAEAEAAAERERTAQAERDAEAKRQREQEEKDHLAEVARQAEQRAREQAECDAQIERERVQAAHEAELKAERDRVAELQRLADEERARVAEEDRKRIAEEERIAAEKLQREADRQHRATVMGEAKTAIMTCGVSEDAARAIVLAIVGGNVPHVRLEF